MTRWDGVTGIVITRSSPPSDYLSQHDVYWTAVLELLVNRGEL